MSEPASPNPPGPDAAAQPPNGGNGVAAVGGADDDGSAVDLAAVFFTYLQTPQGHEVATKVIGFFEGLRKATLDERANARVTQAELHKLTITRAWWLKTVGLLVVTGAIVGLSIPDKLSSAAGTILGAIAGYLLSQHKNAE